MDTARLHLPLLAAAQAQKHVTHNEALSALDAIIHLSVLDRQIDSPPPSPAGVPNSGPSTTTPGSENVCETKPI